MVRTYYGVDVDLSFEHKQGCPKCKHSGGDRSSDNLQVYGLDTQGRHRGAHCFACGWTLPSEEIMEINNAETQEEYEPMGTEFNDGVQEKLKQVTSMDSKGYRGIRADISKKYRVRYLFDEETGQVQRVYYPSTEGMKLSGYKVRSHPKDFRSPGPMGETGRGCELFGQFAFKKSSGKYVLITSGEHDALAAFQMLEDYRSSRGQSEYDPIPVVSPTIGEAGAYKQIQNNYEWLNRFDKIIYCKDPDEAGDKALEKISKVLPKKKLYVMELATVKDPNDALLSGKSKEFLSKFFGASPYVPSGILGSADLLTKMREAALTPKVPLPPFMRNVQGLMAGGIPLKKIVCLGSASGTGKSTIIDEMVYYWLFHSPHKVGVLSLESDSAEYGTKLLSRHVSRKIDLIESPEDKFQYLSSSDVEQKALELFRNEGGEHRFHIIEERDGTLDSVKDLVMQLVIECEAKIVIIDPLQDLLDGTSNEEQATFMKWLKGMNKSHDVTFILVNHVRKNSGGTKANSTGADIHEEDFQGSSSIFKSSSCNLLFTRNKEHPNDLIKNITTMKMTKCRWSGRTSSQAGQYYYCNESHTLTDLEEYLDQNPEKRIEYERAMSEEF